MAWFVNRAPKAVHPFTSGGGKGRRVLDVNITNMFFDRANVQAMIGKRNAAAMSKAGAYIRTRAQTKVLKRKKSRSRPGQPPHVHSKDRVHNLKYIHFFFDKTKESMVVGPSKVPATNAYSPTLMAGYTVPQIMEHGGTITIVEEKPQDTPNVTYDWRRKGVYNNPTRRANPKKRMKHSRGRRRPRKHWKPLPKGDPRKPLLRRRRRVRIDERPFMSVALKMEIKSGLVRKSWYSSVVGAK
jgi:hypothetical protein